MKKSVLIISYEFPPLGGGTANALYHLLKEFSKQKEIKISVVVSSVGRYKEEQFSENIKIHYLDIFKNKNLHFQSFKDLSIYTIKATIFCKKLVKKEKFDLVHAFSGLPAGFIAMRLKLPYIVSLRGSDVPFYSDRFYFWDKIFFQKISKIVWSNSKKVIANSDDLRRLALKTTPNKKIEVIENGVDVANFRQVKKKRQKQLILISTGRLIERKGYFYLIKALEGIKNIKLILIGDGNSLKKLKKESAKRKVKVLFLGKKNHSEIPKLLQKADVFILPSINEGMSNSVLEAMACGLPVIITNTGGAKNMISENGFIVEKKSPESTREAVLKYYSNRDLLKRHSLKSREVAEKFRWGKVADQYLSIYEK